MIEQAVEIMQGLPPEGILVFAFFITFLENVFPPSPSDMLMVFCGTLAGVGAVNAPLLTVVASVGGCAGFVVMYQLGARYGNGILEWRLLKFIPRGSVVKAEQWFAQHGFWLIFLNRFFSGTRAVISLFAGMSHLHLPKTLGLSFAGTLIWNTLLVVGGFLLGDNWRDLGGYLSLYGWIITGGIALMGVIWYIVKYFRRKKLRKMNEDGNGIA
jgi:membrane protein DedA with SNARE-associated domain